MKPLLVLRPEPGASTTAARARALGLQPVVAPLFQIEPIAWEPLPVQQFDALMITSANAVRAAGEGLNLYRKLPAYAVGSASAAALNQAGVSVDYAGQDDVKALLDQMADAGIRSPLHLCGAEAKAVERSGIRVHQVAVYRANPATALSRSAIDTLREEAVVLLHSPRAAATFSAFVTEKSGTRIVAISAAAAAAAGGGWRSVSIAEEPTDAALLAIAARLCEE
jgi:uroporphyrinogen-III synthase